MCFIWVIVLCVAFVKSGAQCMYLSAFLWSVHAHHVVSQKLLKELHLGNAEVEIKTAGHVYLQRVTAHHHLLTRGKRR